MWTFSWLAEIWTLLSSLLLVYGKFNPAAPFSTSGLCWPLPFPFQMLWTRETVRWSAPPWKSCRIWWCLRIWWERLWCLTTGRSSPSSTSSRTWTVSSSHACGQMVRQRDVSAHDCEAVIVLLVPLCSNSFFFTPATATLVSRRTFLSGIWCIYEQYASSGEMFPQSCRNQGNAVQMLNVSFCLTLSLVSSCFLCRNFSVELLSLRVLSFPSLHLDIHLT